MSEEIRPFRIEASDAELEELRRRLRATRWPERETVEDWSQGIRWPTCGKFVSTGPRSTTGARARRA